VWMPEPSAGQGHDDGKWASSTAAVACQASRQGNRTPCNAAGSSALRESRAASEQLCAELEHDSCRVLCDAWRERASLRTEWSKAARTRSRRRFDWSKALRVASKALRRASKGRAVVEQQPRLSERQLGRAEQRFAGVEQDFGRVEQDAGEVEQDFGRVEQDSGRVEQSNFTKLAFHGLHATRPRRVSDAAWLKRRARNRQARAVALAAAEGEGAGEGGGTGAGFPDRLR